MPARSVLLHASKQESCIQPWLHLVLLFTAALARPIQSEQTAIDTKSLRPYTESACYCTQREALPHHGEHLLPMEVHEPSRVMEFIAMAGCIQVDTMHPDATAPCPLERGKRDTAKQTFVSFACACDREGKANKMDKEESRQDGALVNKPPPTLALGIHYTHHMHATLTALGIQHMHAALPGPLHWLFLHSLPPSFPSSLLPSIPPLHAPDPRVLPNCEERENVTSPCRH
jgi:hypothetical protein